MRSSDSYAVIGGSGFYDLFSSPKEVSIQTPFQDKPVILYYQEIEGRKLYFLPRHGKNHSIPPHLINFKANLYALFKLGISRAVATSAVGSLRSDIPPGSIVILNQFIDFRGPITYFDGEFTITYLSGKTLSGVIHLDMTKPYCPEVSQAILSAFNENLIIKKGTYFTFSGPRFETPAEIKALQILGADVVGMTNSSEAILARELGICYGVLAVVTNFAAGLQESVGQNEVLEIFKLHSESLKEKIPEIFAQLPSTKNCNCSIHTK